jgi:FMN phosphatase YigB (HAD superfamily)
MRRSAVHAALVRHGVDVSDPVLDDHLRAAGVLHDEAWLAGRPYKPSLAAEALADGLALPPSVLRDELITGFLDAGAEAELHLAPGIDAVLPALRAAGIPLAIICDVGLTGSQHLRGVLERHGLLRHFGGWAFSDEVGAFKPSAVMFTTALESLGVSEAAGCIHVGDLRRTDVAGARAAGLRTVRYRGLADDQSADPEADDVLDDWADFLPLLGLADSPAAAE